MGSGLAISYFENLPVLGLCGQTSRLPSLTGSALSSNLAWHADEIDDDRPDSTAAPVRMVTVAFVRGNGLPRHGHDAMVRYADAGSRPLYGCVGVGRQKQSGGSE